MEHAMPPVWGTILIPYLTQKCRRGLCTHISMVKEESMHAEPHSATKDLIRGRRVGPNSIFCGSLWRYKATRPVSDFGCSKWMSGRVINAHHWTRRKGSDYGTSRRKATRSQTVLQILSCKTHPSDELFRRAHSRNSVLLPPPQWQGDMKAEYFVEVKGNLRFPLDNIYHGCSSLALYVSSLC